MSHDKPLAQWLHVFNSYVERDGECWLWTGRKSEWGYGIYAGRMAHRDAYTKLVGPIADGLELDHLCRRPACVNPLHLDPVTPAENIRRHLATLTHCKHGHELTEENTLVERGGKRRHCRACARRRAAEYRIRRSQARVTA